MHMITPSAQNVNEYRQNITSISKSFNTSSNNSTSERQPIVDPTDKSGIQVPFLGSNTFSQASTENIGLLSNEQLKRRSQFTLKNTADDLISTLPLKNRVGQCHCCRIDSTQGVKIKHNGKKGKKGKASVTNVMRCGGVWVCAPCASRIMAKRGAQVAKGAENWTGDGGHILMLTTTLRHWTDDKQQDLIDGLRKATAFFWGHRTIKRLFADIGKVGHVKALETTIGDNGFHPHNHYAIFVDYSAKELENYTVSYCLDDDNLAFLVTPFLEKRLISQGRIDDIKTTNLPEFLSLFWIRCSVKAGLRRPTVENGLTLQCADNIKGYLTKIDSNNVGLGHELTNRESKNSCDQFGLLRLYQQGDKKAGKLFQEFALAMKGERALTWSRGLKLLLGVKDMDKSSPDDDDSVSENIAEINPDVWHLIVKRRLRCKLLETAELDFEKGTNELAKQLARLEQDIIEKQQQQIQSRSGQDDYEKWASSLPPSISSLHS